MTTDESLLDLAKKSFITKVNDSQMTTNQGIMSATITSLTAEGREFFANKICTFIKDKDSDVTMFNCDYQVINNWLRCLDIDIVRRTYNLLIDNFSPDNIDAKYDRKGIDGASEYLYHKFLRYCIVSIVHENRKTCYSFDTEDFIY